MIKVVEPFKFRVLLIYPNFQMAHMLLPAGISILSAILKKAGFEVKIFDTTLYKPPHKSFDDIRLEMLQLKRFSLKERSVLYKTNDMLEDFKQLLNEYRPNLVGVSLLQDTYPIAVPMMRETHQRGIPVLAGGIMASFAPDELIQDESENNSTLINRFIQDVEMCLEQLKEETHLKTIVVTIKLINKEYQGLKRLPHNSQT